MTVAPAASPVPALRPARAMLARAVAMLNNGQSRQGAALVYEATIAALRVVAARLNMPCETKEQVWDVLNRLDGWTPEVRQSLYDGAWPGTPYPWHSSYFAAAENFKDYAEVPLEVPADMYEFFISPDDYDREIGTVAKLFAMLETFCNGAAADAET